MPYGFGQGGFFCVFILFGKEGRILLHFMEKIADGSVRGMV